MWFLRDLGNGRGQRGPFLGVIQAFSGRDALLIYPHSMGQNSGTCHTQWYQKYNVVMSFGKCIVALLHGVMIFWLVW